MKKLRIAVLLVTVISLTGLFLACPSSSSSTTPPAEVNKTPSVDDYTITGVRDIFVNDTFPTITVALKSGVDGSPGRVTVKYAGSTSTPSTTSPGAYAVTFDVEAATGWNPVKGLSINGEVVIVKSNDLGIPEFDDFTITPALPWSVYKVGDTFTPVAITAKAGKNQSTPVITYTKSGQPVAVGDVTKSAGTYVVDFTVDVDNVNKWNAANFRAGIIYVREADAQIQVTDITFADFDVTLESPTYEKSVPFTTTGTAASPITSPYSGEAQVIKVVPRPTGNAGGDPGYPIGNFGALNVEYYDVKGETPSKLGIAQTNVGKYRAHVTIAGLVTDKAAWSGTEFDLWFDITQRIPAATDYWFDLQNQAEAGSLLQGNSSFVKHLQINKRPKTHTDNNGDTITDIQGIASPGKITIYYEFLGTTNQDLKTAWDGTKGFSETDVTTGNSTGSTDAILSKRGPQKAEPTSVPGVSVAGVYKVTFEVAAPYAKEVADGDTLNDAQKQDRANWGATTTKLVADNLVLAPLVPVRPVFASFWVDDGVLKLTSDKLYVFPNAPIVFMVEGSGTVLNWYVDSKPVPDNNTKTYTFTSSALGWHEVSLEMSKDGKLYNETVRVRVTEQPPQ